MDLNCYSQRLLNPFRGVMNLIEYAGAEAVTLDGINWDIYVRDSDLLLDLDDRSTMQISDIRYGSWSLKNGLKRGAIFPSDDFKILENRGAIVYEYLLSHHQDIPFALTDHYELWLLDKNNQPLALLDSLVNADEMDIDRTINWKSGIACSKYFSSPSWPDIDRKETPSVCVADYLNYYINHLASDSPVAQWFFRNNKTCTGLEGINLNKQLEHRQLDCHSFPEFFISMNGHDKAHQKLLDDFINWQSPFILLLQNLSHIDRQHFEEQARKQALVTNRLCLLYPEILNETFLNAIKVEAVLRNSQEQNETEEEEARPSYYI